MVLDEMRSGRFEDATQKQFFGEFFFSIAALVSPFMTKKQLRKGKNCDPRRMTEK